MTCSNVFALSNEYSNYDPSKFQYSNDAIKFSVCFNDNWDIYYSYTTMLADIQNFVKPINPANFLYFGMTKNKLLGCRGLVEEVNMDLGDYFAILKDVNAKAISNFSEKNIKINHTPMIYWTYETSGNQFFFAEYIFKKGNYDVRLSFWTLKSLFNKYSKEFDNIMKTFTVEENM